MSSAAATTNTAIKRWSRHVLLPALLPGVKAIVDAGGRPPLFCAWRMKVYSWLAVLGSRPTPTRKLLLKDYESMNEQ